MARRLHQHDDLSENEQAFVEIYLNTGDPVLAAKGAYSHALSGVEPPEVVANHVLHTPKVQAVIRGAKEVWRVHAIGSMIRGLRSRDDDKAGALGVTVLKGLGDLAPDVGGGMAVIIGSMPASLRQEFDAEYEASVKELPPGT